MLHENLKCSCCGYIPDDEDILKTDYTLGKCDCGQENVCDLCLQYSCLDLLEGNVATLLCPTCDDKNIKAGLNRKFYLADEY